MFICYSNPIVYISMCSKHVFASIFYVNYRNTAYSSLVCGVPDLLSFGTDAPPGELKTRYMSAPIGIVGSRLGQRRRRWTNIKPAMGECLVFAGLLVG